MRNKRRKDYSWVLRLPSAEREALLKDAYEQALRVGSIRAVEIRRNIGPNRLYRWAHARKLPVCRPRKEVLPDASA